jgi:uncharacterized membrane protein
MGPAPDRLPATTALRLGRTFFAIATTGSGVQQLVTGEFVRLVPKLPAWLPAPSAWAYAVGVVLIAAGLALMSGRRARLAASVLAVMIVLMFLFQHVPLVVSNPWVGFVWTNPLKTLALAGGAALLAGTLPDEGSALDAWAGRRSLSQQLGAVFLAIFFTVGGVQHFVYHDFVANMVPSWIPGRGFWASFTGVALIAAGVGILVRPTARLAATMSAAMIFLWVVLLHIPRALAGPRHAFELCGVFEALALSGVALMVAGTRSR